MSNYSSGNDYWRYRLKPLLFGVLGLLMASFPAKADTIQVTTSHLLSGPQPPLFGEQSFVLFDPGFDTSLGSLTGVSLVFTGNLAIQFSTVSGYPPVSFPVPLTTFAYLSPDLDRPSGGVGTSTPVQLPNATIAANGSTASISFSFTESSLAPLSAYTNGVGNDSAFLAVNAALYPQYLGALQGNSNLIVTYLNFYSLDPNASAGPRFPLDEETRYTFTGFVTETFTYTVSEPPTIATSLMALLAVALCSYHRRRIEDGLRTTS